MKLNKKIGILILLVCLAGTAFGQFIEAEWIGEPGHPLNPAIGEFIDAINDSIPKIKLFPDNMIGSFADASIYASHGGTQRGYGDFKVMSLTVGPAIGLKVPGDIVNIMKDIFSMDFSDASAAFDIIDGLLDGGDMVLGVGANVNAQLGINAKFIVDGLYLGLSFGYFPASGLSKVDGVDFSMLNIGGLARYNIIKGIDVGVFRWRGLSLSAGYLYQKTDLGLNFAMDFLDGETNSVYDVMRTPSLNFDLVSRSSVIPIEANTAIQLLWFLNINIGGGIDIAFGKNTTSIGLSSEVYDVSDTKIGTIAINAGGEAKVTTFNPKVMAGVGFKLGPVVIDIPLTYYFAKGSHGLSAGVTVGAAF